MIRQYLAKRRNRFGFLAGLLLLVAAAGLSACSAAAGTAGAMGGMEAQNEPGGMSEMDMTHEGDTAHDEGMAEMAHEPMGHDSMGHDSEARQFVPNHGAEVHITAPEDGAVYQSSDNVLVKIETTNFVIGEEGKHWHIYVDGSPTMIMGGESYVLKNLSPGAHQIEVSLSLATHEDLEQGDKISITVEE